MKNQKFSRILRGLALLGGLIGPSLAQCGQVVVVSAKSSVGAMSKDQIAQMFLGKTTTFPDGSAVLLFDQADGSAARDEFYSKVAGKNAAQVKAVWARLVFSGTARPPAAVTGDVAVKQMVAERPGSIGYIASTAVDSSVRVVLEVN